MGVPNSKRVGEARNYRPVLVIVMRGTYRKGTNLLCNAESEWRLQKGEGRNNKGEGIRGRALNIRHCREICNLFLRRLLANIGASRTRLQLGVTCTIPNVVIPTGSQP